MLTISGISKALGGRTLFADVSLQVNRGERIGLVGPNGAGKTTLFSLILGHDTPDTGTVLVQRGATIGHLPQESAPANDETVLQLATTSPVALERTPAPTSYGNPLALAADEPDVEFHHDHLSPFELEPLAKRNLRGLGFRETDFDRPARTLSGGWVMRAHLARLLAQEPDLLLLDEPTNHLDLEALIWFQEHLKQYQGGILLISHDREFLNQLAGSILEIRSERIYRYRGNYDEYLVQREAQVLQQEAAYKNQQREIDRLQRFVDRFRAKASKAAQAQSKIKQIERMDLVSAPESSDSSIGFEFPQPKRAGQHVITLKDIHFSYGTQPVYAGLNFQAERGQRIVLVGPNGAGKSTLLKILAGVLPIQAGERLLGHHVKSGYYAQYRIEMLQPGHTVLEEALETPCRVTEEFVRTVLGSFLFRGDDVFKRVEVLSGGEKSRLALVKLLLDPPNLLLMDEPTTHLDFSSVDVLIGAMSQFTGTMIFISHDVHFIRSLGNHVVHVKSGRVTHYPGSYQYYLDKTASLTESTIPVDSQTSATGPRNQTREQKRLEAEQRQARYRVRKAQETIVHRLEKEITELETEQGHLTAELQDPATYEQNGRIVEINCRLAEIRERLPHLAIDWESAAEALARLEGAAD